MDTSLQAISSIITIDPNGDLVIVVGLGLESKRFRVSTQVLRLASPLWCAMLSPQHGFEESTLKAKGIAFPDDGLEVCSIVLFVRVPSRKW